MGVINNIDELRTYQPYINLYNRLFGTSLAALTPKQLGQIKVQANLLLVKSSTEIYAVSDFDIPIEYQGINFIPARGNMQIPVPPMWESSINSKSIDISFEDITNEWLPRVNNNALASSSVLIMTLHMGPDCEQLFTKTWFNGYVSSTEIEIKPADGTVKFKMEITPITAKLDDAAKGWSSQSTWKTQYPNDNWHKFVGITPSGTWKT
jgi:hypothetical protein